ncbi:hypothetical protein NE237_016418 [Protea cynaroides]|uniref:Uncharacterized protein n=1 Tax=Protea cynaroides TaxID=273540 RepID=A0A9Q0HIL8_9MAGN|nr:hypothetical protein NE237_016418 [Protea cynaroides]
MKTIEMGVISISVILNPPFLVCFSMLFFFQRLVPSQFVNSMRVLNHHHVELERSLRSSKKTRDEVADDKKKANSEIARLKAELVIEKRRVKEKQARLKAELATEGKKSNEAISKNICLESKLTVLRETKKEIEKVLFEFKHQAQMDDLKVKNATWNAQELEANMPGKIG